MSEQLEKRCRALTYLTKSSDDSLWPRLCENAKRFEGDLDGYALDRRVRIRLFSTGHTDSAKVAAQD